MCSKWVNDGRFSAWRFSFFNCSLTKFYLQFYLSVFFMRFFAWQIFCLTHLTFRPQKRDKQVAPSGHYVLLEPFSPVSAQTVLDTKGRLSLIEDPHTPPLTPHYCPHSSRAVASISPPVQPPSPVATDEQPLAKTTQIYTNFHIFSQAVPFFECYRP